MASADLHAPPLPRLPRSRRRPVCRRLVARWLIFFLLLLLGWTASALVLDGAWAAQSTHEANAPPVEVRLMNRPIVVLRATLAGVTPEARAKRTDDRFAALVPADLVQPVTMSAGDLDNQHGYAIYVGDKLLMGVVEGDLDPEDKLTLEAAVRQVVASVTDAVAARREQQHWPTLLNGLLRASGALVVVALLLWGLSRTRRWLQGAVQASLQRHLVSRTTDGFDWTTALYQLTERVVRIVAFALMALMAFVWLEFALLQFPLTHPLGRRMGTYLWRLLDQVATACVDAIPGLVVVAVILFITRGVQIVVSSVFTASARGSLKLPGLHPETAPATRRLAAVLVWALGLTFAYPYIPGSQSDVFKGVSVLLGFMLTLGSANVVNQIMSGMVLVYSRALRVGDMVSIGDTVGWVEGLGALSVKLINLRQEEVTLPNAVVVASAVHNFSRAGQQNPDRGALLSTAVTIGYDTPWRQVHGMLLEAVATVPGVAAQPTPFVLQRGLSDFYVEYELFFAIADPRRRFFVLSALHAAIQDEFNRRDVQIMSPHFVLQPRQPVTVPPAQWHTPPARPDAQDRT